MNKQITIALLFIICAFTACKKEKGTHVDIVGTWKVAKIETTTAGAATLTYTGTSADTFEFRNNEGNEMIVNLKSVSSIGIYNVLVNQGLKFSYNGKTYSGEVNTISESKLEFTVNIEGASPTTTEKYYFTK